MVIPSLEETERKYAAREISKQKAYQWRHANTGLCWFCSKKATHGRICKDHAKAASERRAGNGAKKSTCKNCKKKGHYRKTCQALP
jgi:hypothetical protein